MLRFIQPVYGDTEHRVLVKVAAPLCIVVGNLAINISVPKIAEYEGWHNATLRNDSLCVKLAIFQVLNSLAGGAMMFVYEGYSLTPEWYTMAGQMTSAIILFTILSARTRRPCRARCRRHAPARLTRLHSGCARAQLPTAWACSGSAPASAESSSLRARARRQTPTARSRQRTRATCRSASASSSST